MKEKKVIVVLALIIILIGLYLLKNNYKKDLETPLNRFQEYNFYKQENLARYTNYQKQTGLDDRKTILYVNIGLDKDFYTHIRKSPKQNTNYILVNKYHFLDKNYVPDNLVKVSEYAQSNLLLNKEAYEAFKQMARDASIQNLNLRIISAYRSYDYQENLYNRYLENERQELVDTYSARAGHSEHQTGLAVDIDNKKSLYIDFLKTEEFLWMKNNCYKYGFILRYPENKEHITGYTYEPWHYRYIGIKESTYIHNHNLTFEEYFYEFIDTLDFYN